MTCQDSDIITDDYRTTRQALVVKNGNKGTICTKVSNFAKMAPVVKWRPGGCIVGGQKIDFV